MQALQTAELKFWCRTRCRIRRCHNSMDHSLLSTSREVVSLIYKLTHRSRIGQESVKCKQRKIHSSFQPRFLQEQLERSKLSIIL